MHNTAWRRSRRAGARARDAVDTGRAFPHRRPYENVPGRTSVPIDTERPTSLTSFSTAVAPWLPLPGHRAAGLRHLQRATRTLKADRIDALPLRGRQPVPRSPVTLRSGDDR